MGRKSIIKFLFFNTLTLPLRLAAMFVAAFIIVHIRATEYARRSHNRIAYWEKAKKKRK